MIIDSDAAMRTDFLLFLFVSDYETSVCVIQNEWTQRRPAKTL